MRAKEKIKTQQELCPLRRQWRRDQKSLVFTNGCFDLLHVGHVRYLAAARALGDILLVGVNDDTSVRRLKGPGRPIIPAQERCEVLAGLSSVDFVTTFEEDTPLNVITRIRPDVLVKGGDWPPEQIVGREFVESTGGSVYVIGFEEGYSSTAIIDRVRQPV